jgi:hypothetical protein
MIGSSNKAEEYRDDLFMFLKGYLKGSALEKRGLFSESTIKERSTLNNSCHNNCKVLLLKPLYICLK